MQKSKRKQQLNDDSFSQLIRAIVANDLAKTRELLQGAPSLASEAAAAGATRERASEHFFAEIAHYMYAGDTALHVAAAAYRENVVCELLNIGAAVTATNRRGAQPLHYAADGGPTLPTWNPDAQAKTVAMLLKAGADPNAIDKSGVAPLHRAVRTRCTSAARELLLGGANVQLKNKSGSTPLHLAVQNTGRGGSGSDESKAHQREIILLLLAHGATPNDTDGTGKTVSESIQSAWIRDLF